MKEKTSLFGKTLSDLRRRKVFRVAATYGVIAWLTIEVASVVLPALHSPEWIVSAIVIAALSGFPIVLLLAWVFDLTPKGVVRTEAVGEGAPEVRRIARRGIDFVVIAVLLSIVGYLAYQQDFFSTEASGERSIAVLPFVDLSAEGDNEYFSDGISEELLNSLVGIDGLRVAARTSSFAFKGRNEDIRLIGEKLNVRTVLEGSVRRAGDQLRITAQLINVEDGFHLWSETFDRKFNDIFTIQTEIAQSIVDALELELVGSNSKSLGDFADVDIRAYDLYLLGRHHWHKRTNESLERALGLFQEAVTIDPNFALAYTGLADTYLLMDGYGDLTSKEATAKAESPVARALALDDKLAEAYASLGLLRLNQGELSAAEMALRSAVDLNPNYSMAHMWLGIVLNQMSGPSAGLVEYQRAIDRDPLHPSINFNLAMTLGNIGQYDKAVSRLRESLDADPDNDKAFFAMEELNRIYGHFDEAARWAMKGIRDYDYGSSYLSMAKILTYLGQFDRAEQYLDRAASHTPYAMQMFFARVEFLYVSKRFGELAELAETLDVVEKQAYRMIWMGVAHVSSGLVSRGVEELRKGLDEASAMGIPPEEMMILMSIQAYGESASGNSDAAAKTRTRALAMSAEAGDQGWATPQIDAITALLLSMDGRDSEALVKLRSAIDRGWRDYWSANSHPAFEQMMENPDFRELMAEVQRDLSDMKVIVDKIEIESPSGSRVAMATGR
jgi:TolB-like protein/tetratricopeptide (TPR) repeat protein